MRYVIILFLFPLFSYAQVVVSGRVVEEFTENPIPYATIGLLKQSIGTNANEQGEFTITCQNSDLDSLIVSCIGYVTLRLPVRLVIEHPTLSLSVSVKPLRVVTVKNQWAYSEVGAYNKYQDYCFTSSGYHSQVAKRVSAPFAKAQLQSVHVRLSKNSPDSCIFRIHVYQFDSLTRGPGKELTDTIIEVRSKWGMISIDMSPYQIDLPDKDFFVSMEWLRVPFNERYSNTKFEGRDTVFLTYRPCICFTKDAPSRPDEIWHLAYSGTWFSRRPQESSYSLAISASVKY